MSSFGSSSGIQESGSRSNPNPEQILDNHVFLSFRGTHSVVSFVSHLYISLQDAGASVIYIDEDLRSKDQISTSPLQEIQRSRASIIVFSKYYADSRFCLEDLEKIMECHKTMGQAVVPVFYGVDPSEVRDLTGKFGEAFEGLTKRKSMEKDKVLSWRAALCEARSISGFVAKESGDESEVIKNVVEHVIDHLLDSTELFIAKHLVGVENYVQTLIDLSDYRKRPNIQRIGICGRRGVGKTTIAKAIYNQISHNFEGSIFLPNISETCKKDTSQVSLKERLFSSLCKTTKIKIDNVESGKVILKERLCCKRVLLILDGVDDLEPLDALIEGCEWFGPGSKIIITTRYAQIAKLCNVERLVTVDSWTFEEALELFSWYAFNQSYPKADFHELSRHLVSRSMRLPLALEVLGSQRRFGKGMMEWQIALDKLKRCSLGEVEHEVVKACFDHLQDIEKEIFLNITCFFVGIDRNDVIYILNDFGYSAEIGINVLEKQGFVTIDEKNKLGMHVVLQNMGKMIIFGEPKSNLESRFFDVCLSFRGEDTRASFTSHLYTSLQNAGIYVFKDDEEIQRGDQVSISLLQAIARSSISVIILSRNYPNSRWCLQELENIMECRRTTGLVVVPVFYGVDPSEVRNQKGLFGEAFEDLLRRMSVQQDKERSWRKALVEVGGIAGFVILKSRNESEDIKKIVEHVTHLLDKTDLFVANHPVGVESRVQDVIKLLNNHQSKGPLLLGIWGMGGLGKTTIAKAIYNQIGRKFGGRSFLLNVREGWKQDSGGVHLQEQVLADIYKTTKIKIRNIESGKLTLKERLNKTRILLVLDDVNEKEQLDALCGSHEWFGLESTIIITTRDVHLLHVLRVDYIYRMENMCEIESIELFSWHAFKQESPIEEFVRLSNDVIAYSAGLPLALEVLGSHLFGRGIKEWKSVLEQLKRIPNNEVQKKLKISFNGLSDGTEKEIFLDIAFFLIGMERSDAIDILNGCGHSAEIGINVLVERSLVTIDNKNKLRMHDLLRDMGREVVREKAPEEPEERSRLWHPDEVLDVLSKDMGTKAVNGLALKLPRMDTIHLKTKAFKKMKRLRLLQLSGVQLEGDFKYLSRDLKWLSWRGFPSTITPANFDQGSLVAIDLKYSNLQLVWMKGQLLKKLKILNLSHSHYLEQTPDFLYLPNLEKLILKDCPRLSTVSKTIGHLNELLLINLKGCTSIRELPRSIYKLKSLKTLILSGCLMIDKLEEDLEQMESLTTLIADNTAITQVPQSIVRLKNIGYISLCGYEGFSRDVIPSIIWCWNSPTNVLSSLMQTFAGLSCPVSLDVPNRSFHGLSSAFIELPKVQILRLECGSELQITGDVALNATNWKELEAMAKISTMESSALANCRSQVDISESKSSLSSFLIRMGMNSAVTDILRESILQNLNTSGPGDCLLPDDKNFDWLTFNGEGSSVIFEVPQVNGRNLKTMMLCVVYSSVPDIITSPGLKNLLIINYTKATTQVYERDTLTSFEDEDWQSVISNLEPGNKVQVIVFAHGFNVKKTAVYLIYDKPIDEKMEHCHAADKNVTVSSGSDIVSGRDDLAANDNVIVLGGDDMAEVKNVILSGGDDMATDNDVIVLGSDDMPADDNVNVCDGDYMPEDKSIIVSSSNENRLRMPFTLPSLLFSPPLWFGLAAFLIWTRRRSDKRRR